MEVELGSKVVVKSGADEAPDKEIVRLVQGGEREAFAELVLRHQDMVFSMILRQTGDASLSEELAQEVFIQAYANIKKFRGDAKFSTWLVRIALNHTYSYYRTKSYKQRVQQESLDELTLEIRDTSASDELALRASLQVYRFAIASLSEQLRDTVVLCCLEGYSYEEAAGILEVPVGTVRSRLNTARRKLRKTLVENGLLSQQEVEEV